ncbi:hypothetical protein DMH17_07505 [Raoultella planticola]|nr:hypothetical protein [Raoultella planticola]
MNHQIGYVTMDKQFTGLKPVKRSAGTRLSEHPIHRKRGFLRLRQCREKSRVFFHQHFDHSALLLMSVSISFMDVYGL